MSSASEPGSMHTAAGQRLHTHTHAGSMFQDRKQCDASQTPAGGTDSTAACTEPCSRKYRASPADARTGSQKKNNGMQGHRSRVQRHCTQGAGVRCHAYKHTLMQTLCVHALHNFVTKLHPTRNWIHARSVNKDICSRLETHRCQQEKSVALLEE